MQLKMQDRVLLVVVLLALASAAAVVAWQADQATAGSDKLQVLVVYESGDLTPEVSGVIASKDAKTYMQSHGVDGLNFLCLDKDSDLSALPKGWQELRDQIKDVPGIAVRAGRKGHVGPLPPIQETLTLLKKYGGE